MSDREEEEKPFVVRDRRRFTETGEAREGIEDESSPPSGAARAAEDALRGGPRGPSPEEEPLQAQGGAPTDEQAAPTDFITLIFSLGSSALIHLGDAPNPETGRTEKNLPLAKQTIDLLVTLQEKTRGNLTPEEERFFSSLLYDLRLRFVEASR